MSRLSTVPVSEEKDMRRAGIRQNVDRDRDLIVEYLKKTREEVSVAVLAKDLKMKNNRPSFVANFFPMTLVTFSVHHTGKHVYYIDLHPHLRRYHQ